MRYILFWIFSFSVLSCNQQVSMENTTWQYDYANGKLDEIKFFNQKYTQYSAETGEYYYGNYTTNGDTIIMHQERGGFDYEFEEDSPHRAGGGMSKMIIKNGTQLGYIDNWQKDHWRDNYFFSPVDSKVE